MRKTNFVQARKQRESTKKARQLDKQQRRTERNKETDDKLPESSEQEQKTLTGSVASS